MKGINGFPRILFNCKYLLNVIVEKENILDDGFQVKLIKAALGKEITVQHVTNR